MARDGSGGYSIAASSWNPATNGNSATASDWNALLSDMVTAIEGSVAADGQTPMTGNLQMGNNKATGLAAATTLGDALRLENLIAGADIASASTVTIPLEGNYFSITGTTGITGFSSTRAGRGVWIKFTGILTLTNSSSFALPDSANITTAAGDTALFVFDGTNWICQLYIPLVLTPVKLKANMNASGSAPMYACRAWVKFNGTTGAIAASGNVSSVTRNAVGDYTIAFTTAMPDANYSVMGTANGSSGTFAYVCVDTAVLPTTTQLRIKTGYGVGTLDSDNVSVSIFR